VCDLEATVMLRHWDTRGCCAVEGRREGKKVNYRCRNWMLINVVFILSGKRVFIFFVTVVREKNGLKALLLRIGLHRVNRTGLIVI
jgi:hypothetical protein